VLPREEESRFLPAGDCRCDQRATTQLFSIRTLSLIAVNLRGEAMIHPGDRLENPITGEALVFHRTSAETDGESVVVETIVRPRGFLAAAHVHPHQTERFEVLEGVLGLRVGDRS
jgi:hypothetical protein